MAIPQSAINSIQQGVEPQYLVRDVLAWFGKTRRGVNVVAAIHGALSAANLETDPSFETAYLDEPVKIKRTGGPIEDDIVRGGTVDDPVIRVTSVAAAHRLYPLRFKLLEVREGVPAALLSQKRYQALGD